MPRQWRQRCLLEYYAQGQLHHTQCDLGYQSVVPISLPVLISSLPKSAPLYRHWGSVQAVRPTGEVEVQLYSFLTTALEGDEGSASRPVHSLPRERPGTHCAGGWVGPRAGGDRCGKSRPQRDSIPGPSSPYPFAIPTTLPGPQAVYCYIE
jgi:hypothetical protein